jgi:acetate kinase
MKILVINSGSSSIKYKLYEMDAGRVVAEGLVERIGEEMGSLRHKAVVGGESHEERRQVFVADHRVGLRLAVDLLSAGEYAVIASPEEIDAVGHRVVHGGERFSAPIIIDAGVKEAVRALSPFAPLHNPANLMGVEVAEELFPHAPQVAVFDTAFHQTMPPRAYRYAIPNRLYHEDGIRAYGFHGASHGYVARVAAAHLGRREAETNLITAHLGNGCSITAVQGGRSVDTSMGFSPLPGLMMGTRSGDLDPAVVFYLGMEHAMSLAAIDRLLNKESGLLGVAGQNDVRSVLALVEAGNTDATLAMEMYTYRIKKYIGAYMAALGRVDALVFTAGVGENSAFVRWHSCVGLENLGITLDPVRNDAGKTGPVTEIHAAHSRVKALVIPTDEEWEIARQTAEVAARREMSS